ATQPQSSPELFNKVTHRGEINGDPSLAIHDHCCFCLSDTRDAGYGVWRIARSNLPLFAANGPRAASERCPHLNRERHQPAGVGRCNRISAISYRICRLLPIEESVSSEPRACRSSNLLLV